MTGLPTSTPPLAVTFDLWATLLESPRVGSQARHRFRVEALHTALRRRGDATDPDTIARLMTDEWSRYNTIWREESRTLLNPERLAWMVEQLGLAPLEPEVTSALSAAFDDSLWRGPPALVDGARPLLAQLARAGVRLGVISDTSYSTGATLRRLLAREGVLEYFEVLTFSDEFGRSKPHPDLFHRTLEALETPPERAVHVGDNPHTDILGARRVGMGAVYFVGCLSSPEGCADAHHTISRLDALLPLLLSSPRS